MMLLCVDAVMFLASRRDGERSEQMDALGRRVRRFRDAWRNGLETNEDETFANQVLQQIDRMEDNLYTRRYYVDASLLFQLAFKLQNPELSIMTVPVDPNTVWDIPLDQNTFRTFRGWTTRSDIVAPVEAGLNPGEAARYLIAVARRQALLLLEVGRADLSNQWRQFAAYVSHVWKNLAPYYQDYQ